MKERRNGKSAAASAAATGISGGRSRGRITRIDGHGMLGIRTDPGFPTLVSELGEVEGSAAWRFHLQHSGQGVCF